MKIEASGTPGKILIDCLDCGAMFPVEDFREGSFAGTAAEMYERSRYCPDCEEKRKSEESRRIREARRAELAARLPELLERSGVEYYYCHDRETGELFAVPPCRAAAEWLYRHRRENVLLSGVTGTGKSTSACFVAMGLIAEERKVRYVNLRKLLAEWRAAKTSDAPFAAEKMLRGLFALDLCIIDEVVGKARISESGQELLFELLESVNSGACRSRIWLLGNFYTGSIEAIFADPEPVRRRLQENFVCACITAQGEIKTIQVYGGMKR